MASASRFYCFTLTIISLSCFGQSKSKLPILTTKQEIKNIRYLSIDGKNTYYQRRSGSFYLSTKFKLFEIIKGKKGTEYSSSTSYYQTKMAITVNRNYHTLFSIRKPLEIYVTELGKPSAKYIDTGVNPNLHLKDEWISFYKHKEKQLQFSNIKNDINNFQIKIGSQLNPYFVPEVIMLNDFEIVYTDINNNGFPGIIHFNRTTKIFTSLYKSVSISKKLEFCYNEKDLFIIELSIGQQAGGTNIYYIKTPSNYKKLKSKDIIYSSKLNDIGKMVCPRNHQNLYFVQNLTNPSGKEYFEVSKIDLKTRKVDVISNLKNVTNLIYHGGRVIIPMHGVNYVVFGNHELPDDKINFETVEQQ